MKSRSNLFSAVLIALTAALAACTNNHQYTTLTVNKAPSFDEIEKNGTDSVRTAPVQILSRPMILIYAGAKGGVRKKDMQSILLCRARKYGLETGYGVMDTSLFRVEFRQIGNGAMLSLWSMQAMYRSSLSREEAEKQADACDGLSPKLMGMTSNEMRSKKMNSRCKEHSCTTP